MSYGMTYDQYWYGDPWMLVMFRRAHLLKRKEQNVNFWLQGVYNFKAFDTVLANAFRKKGEKAQPYLKQPLDIFPKTQEELEEEARKEREKIIKTLTAWGKAFNNNKDDDD